MKTSSHHHPRPALIIASLLLMTACVYDWEVGNEPANGGTSGAAGSGGTVGQDAPSEAAISANCAVLKQAMTEKRAILDACEPSWIVCNMEYFDECGCKRGSQDAVGSDEYQDLVQQYEEEQCTFAQCETCPNVAWDWECREAGGFNTCVPAP